MSLRYLTAVSMSSLVLRGMFNDSLLSTNCRKISQFVFLLLMLGCILVLFADVDKMIKTGEWSEDKSKHDFLP